jgi:hypothetical protein
MSGFAFAAQSPAASSGSLVAQAATHEYPLEIPIKRRYR